MLRCRRPQKNSAPEPKLLLSGSSVFVARFQKPVKPTLSPSRSFVPEVRLPRTIALFADRVPKRISFAKLGVVIEEVDETLFWLELLVETNILSPKKLVSLIDEANQLTAIFVASRETARGNEK